MMFKIWNRINKLDVNVIIDKKFLMCLIYFNLKKYMYVWMVGWGSYYN